ncbi:MAG: ribosome small subunit-dependent GTPase A [Eubacteriales bacterium]|nr:ribosome small subunit-dependent GTPase A [Eubacteriales bacterium]MCI7570396.1 ribosome small subunit-dependent GTPase A [Clostridiales bacterium]MDD7550609.1 ribosome small subunit-dependent GTPase A [Clostridia bacterium]MDY5754175.1 ribosome small subunit-dependent GTPase A [Eubacteriales bacterium]
MTGTLLKGVGSFYTVLDASGERFVCRPRGRFRVEKLTPLPGDKVEFDYSGDEGYLLRILPRKNKLIRPAVANVDKLIIIVSASVPKADLLLADKLLIYCELHDITPIIVINKCDDVSDTDAIAKQYAHSGYTLYSVSAHTGKGLGDLRLAMTGSVCCLCGQSAVGKSSLINALVPDLELEVGGLSKKTDRGRHTTRHAELLPLGNGTMIVDTPGFSLFDTEQIEVERLSSLFPEMKPYDNRCRFAGCIHKSEPDCAVKDAVADGEIPKERYLRYITIAEELIEKRKHCYD